MTRKIPKFLSIIAFAIAIAVTLQSSFAQQGNRTFHVGSGSADGSRYFNTLEELRIYTQTGNGGGGSNFYNFFNGDTIILYKNDNSLTKELGIGDNASVTVRSNDETIKRIIEILPQHNALFFNMNQLSAAGSTLNLENLILRNGRQTTLSGGGAILAWWHNNLNIHNTDFVGNFSVSGSGGGAIYYWDALDCRIVDSNFINNKTTGRGGALFINASGTLYQSDTTNVTLEVSDGRTSTFAGNLQRVNYDGTGGTANSIDFTGWRGNTVNFNIITGEDGVLDLRDPFQTNPSYGEEGYYVNITKTGVGTWKLGGVSVVDGSSRTIISISEGTLDFYANAALRAVGTNDQFVVRAGAEVILRGGNTIEGTNVLFEGRNAQHPSGAILSFDMDFYKSNPLSTSMLYLAGSTLQVSGVTINADFTGNAVNGIYTLIQGGTTLDAEQFQLYINGDSIDVSGNVSERYGYALSNTNGDTAIVLTISDLDNAIVQWRDIGTNNWNINDKTWTLPYRSNQVDSFVGGDTAVFNLSGDRTITITKNNAVIGANTDGIYTYYRNNGIGMHVGGNGNWTFNGLSITDRYNAETPIESQKAGLYFDGTGILTLANTNANTFHGLITIAGGGTLQTDRADLLGLGGVRFQNNRQNTLHFTGSTTMDQMITVASGGKGVVTVRDGQVLTLTGAKAGTNGGAAYTSGGALTFQGGQTTSSAVQFVKNKATLGGAIYAQNGSVHVVNGLFKDNEATSQGGAIYFAGNASSTLTIEASEGMQSLFLSNKALTGSTTDGVSNSIYASGGTVIIDAKREGIINMLDPMTGTSGTTVRKTGQGTWALAGQNEFTGANTNQLIVSEGILSLYKENAVTGGNVAGGLSIAGTFTIEDGGVLQANGGNTIFATNISLAENATLAFNMNGVSAGNDALLDMTASNWSGTNWRDNKYIDLKYIDMTLIGKTDPAKRYNLVTLNDASIASGIQNNDLTVQYNGVNISNLRQNFAKLVYQNNTLSVDLMAPINGVVVWNPNLVDPNNVDRNWNLVSKNWSGTNAGDGDLTGATQFFDGDAVRFTNVGAGTINIVSRGVTLADHKSGAVAGLTINNSTGSDYTFQGGSIGGQARLEKTGTGTVTLVEANSFTRGSNIQGGTVVARKTTSLGTGDIVIGSAGTLNWNVDPYYSGTLAQKMSGTGILLKSGGGSVTLNGSNADFRGTTQIRGGELVFTALDAVGSSLIDTGIGSQNGLLAFEGVSGSFDKQISGSGGVRAGSGSDIVLTNTSNNYSGMTIVSQGGKLTSDGLAATGTGNFRVDGTLVLRLASATDFNGRLVSGSGLVEKRGSGVLKITGNHAFTGTMHMLEGGLLLNNATGLANATVKFDGDRLSFDNNTEITLGGLAGNKSIQLRNDNGQTVNLILTGNANDNTYYGVLSGAGSVTKKGAGTQKLLGTNTYTGGTYIQEGTLIFGGSVALGIGTIVNEGILGFEITGSDTIDQLINGTGGLLKTGAGTLTMLGENEFLGGTTIQQGTLKVLSLQSLATQYAGTTATAGHVQIDQGATLEVDIDSLTTATVDNTFKGGLNGAGTLVKKGAGSLFLNENIGLDGAISVRKGTLYINANTFASVDVVYGGTLSGTGSVDNSVMVRNGSFHRVDYRPDGPLGTFSAKSIGYESGSTIYIKIGSNGADQIIGAEGINFALGGGTVDVVLINMSLDTETAGEGSRNYKVFTAENGNLMLNGTKIRNGQSESNVLTMDGVNGEVRFLGDMAEGLTVYGYTVQANGATGKSLYLSLGMVPAGAAMLSSYMSPNQLAVLGGIGSADMLDRVYSYNKGSRGGVLDQLMPMVQTAFPYMTQRSVTQFNTGTFERLRYLREPGHQLLAANGTGEETYRANAHPLGAASHANALWFHNYGDFVIMGEKGDRPEFRADSYGFNLGYDRKIHHRSTVGVGMGGTFSTIRTNQGLQRGDMDSFLMALYGDWIDRDQCTISLATGFVFSDYATTRRAPAFDSQLEGNHTGTTYFCSVEGRKKFLLGECELTPYVGVDLINLHEKAYSERATMGDDVLALRVDKRNTFSILSNVGLRLGRTFRPLGGNSVTPSVYAAWVHDWNKSGIYADASFAGQPIFRISGASMYRDRAQVGTNINMTLNSRADLFGRFNAELGDHLSDLSVHWGLRVGF